MLNTVKELIDVLSDLPDDTQIYFESSEPAFKTGKFEAYKRIIPAEVEVQTILDKSTNDIDGVILTTVLSEKMQKLIND